MHSTRPIFLSLFLLVTTIGPADKAVAQGPLPVNGSFEDGQSTPTGWALRGEGRWATGEGHRGKRWLAAHSEKGEVIWESNEIEVQPATAYRLDGWLRTSNGEGRVGVDLLDENGKVLEQVETPTVRSISSWRYVALDLPAAKGKSLRLWFWAKGEAELDDVALVPAAQSFIANKSMDGDQRGRVSFWNEERDPATLPGRKAGQFRIDTEVKHSGKTSLQLTATGDWYGFTSVHYPLPGWTERIQLSCWARAEAPASAQLLACWVDDVQKVLRVDAGPTVQGSDWQPISTVLPAPPAKAASIRLLVVARNGKAWFDDFELLRLPAHQPVARLFVNQVGYEKAGPKSAVLATNLFPANNSAIQCELVDAQGKSVWQGEAFCSGRILPGTSDDWGWYFWRINFTPFRGDGVYRLRTKGDGTAAESPPIAVRQGLLLHETSQSAIDFFYIQRCGCEVPGWHKACHLDDAKLPDGSHLDLTGGWHSAGDYNKLMYEHGDGGVVFAMMQMYASAPEHFDRVDRDGNGTPDILEEAKWGADFVAKMQIPETGGVRNHVKQGPGTNWKKWSAPEVHTDNKIGTRDDPMVEAGEGQSPLAIGGWARLSELLTRREVKNDFLERAEKLWQHDTKNKGASDSDYLLLSAIELHRVTGRADYLDFARQSATKILASQTQSGRLRGAFGTYGQGQAAALAQFALSQPKDSLVPAIKGGLTKYIDFCVSTADNAFGLGKQKVGEGEAFFSEGLGNNFEWLGRAWAAAFCYRVTHDERALTYAADHVDWVLGKNPVGLCMFEGKGTLNPPRYHHRYNAIPGHERGAVPGTVPNGFVRELGLADRAGFDMSRGGGKNPSFRTSEPWLVHNLFYLLAASALNDAYRPEP